jgi:hypothetical protein
MSAEPITDHQFRNERGGILVREPMPGSPWWLVTWLPGRSCRRELSGLDDEL